MGAIKREPTPPGPVTHLFNRLHQIHLVAGQPSIREIAGKVGRGVISSSTIHNMFRGPRVPRWGFLELVVETLDGNVEEFRTGQDTLADCCASLGPDHPDTLMAAVNLAIDVGRSGNQPRAERLLDDALNRYAATLTTEHPEAQAASRGDRLTAEIEPYSY